MLDGLCELQNQVNCSGGGWEMSESKILGNLQFVFLLIALAPLIFPCSSFPFI